jgi:hypothetical protein
MGIPMTLLWDCLPTMLAMTAISVVYFAADKEALGVSRIALSAHGVLATILFAGAIALWRAYIRKLL